MISHFKPFLKVIIPLTIGVFFIYLSVHNTTSEEREIIYSYFKNADIRYVVISMICGILSHFSRAYRWMFLLSPLGYRPSMANTTLAVMVAYFANLGIPRSGEVLRATTLRTYEKIPFEKSFGTIVAERFIDLILLALFVVLAMFLQFNTILPFIVESETDLYFSGMIILLLVGLFFLLRRLFKKSEITWIVKIKKVAASFWEGILSLKKMKKKIPFLLHTLFIWGMYFMMFYVIKYTVPETYDLNFLELIPAFVVGGLTISATNGGIGIYPFSVALVLSTIPVPNEAGLAFGWIIWTTQTVLVIVFGSLSFFLLPLVNRKKS